jgi:hypothetical protein
MTVAGSKTRRGTGRQPNKTGRRTKRPGLPPQSSVLSEETFISPRNKQYRILKTSERDSYDEPDPAAKPKRR